MLTIKLGVIAALPFEAACFTRNEIRPGNYRAVTQDLNVFYAGMGPDKATRAAQTLIDSGVDALVSWGVAAALDPELVAGDIVLPVEVLDVAGQLYQVDLEWHSALKNKLNQQGVHSGGRLVSTHHVQHDEHLKSELHQSTQAVALDMESAAIARVAVDADRPFIVIRSIFDTVAMSIPTSSTNATDQYGQVSITKLISGLIKNPLELLHYLKLVSSFTKARASLRRVVELCGYELCLYKKL